MNFIPQLLLIGAVAAVGVLHTIVPDHWVPITLIARQRGWSKRETARAAFFAGVGHVTTTLILGLIVWLAGVAVATSFGHLVDTLSSLALVAFGLWFAISAWRELHSSGGHGHSHNHEFQYLEGQVHGPELQRISTPQGDIELSIFEHGMPPCFRLTGTDVNTISIETMRQDGTKQTFECTNQGGYWESVEAIPEPHQFAVAISLDSKGQIVSYMTKFTEHSHGHHGHDHSVATKKSTRTTLLLILGSSPMIEGIPAFFAAAKYGIWIIALMALVFAIATIATYVLLSVYSTAGLEKMKLGAFEKYGEVMSGAFIAAVGLFFWIFPVL